MKLVIVTDHHLGDSACAVNRGYAPAWALNRVLDAISAAGRHGADALLSTGDLVDRGNDCEYAFARSLLGIRAEGTAPGPLISARPGLEGMPIYLVPGNHDPRKAWLDNLFPATQLTVPLDLTFEVADQAFVYLDLGSDGRAGELRERSLVTLDEATAEGRATVLVLHHHPVEVGVPWLDRALPAAIDRVWERLDRGIVAVLFGHAHATVDTSVRGVPVLGTRSTCFQFAATQTPEFVIQPLHYRTLTVEGVHVTTERFEVPLTGPPEPRRAA